jgi:hypothetical protein
LRTINKIVSAFLAALFMTGLLVSAPVSAAESNCATVNHIESLSDEEFHKLYES